MALGSIYNGREFDSLQQLLFRAGMVLVEIYRNHDAMCLTVEYMRLGCQRQKFNLPEMMDFKAQSKLALVTIKMQAAQARPSIPAMS